MTNADEMAELVPPDQEQLGIAPRVDATTPGGGGRRPHASSPAPVAAAISPAIDPTGTRVRLLDALSERSGTRRSPRSPSSRAWRADRVRAELGMLELEGIVHEAPGGWLKFTKTQLEKAGRMR